MGSGKKFRVSWHPWNLWDVGFAVVFRSEHEVSIHINFLRFGVYVGIGKGYEDF